MGQDHSSILKCGGVKYEKNITVIFTQVDCTLLALYSTCMVLFAKRVHILG